MLTYLQIRDVALIDELDLAFGPGLQVLTGETGAGKSIIIDALGLVLGARANRDLVRAGAESASVQAAFYVKEANAVLAAWDRLGLPGSFDPHEEELILRRDVSRTGPSRCWINGRQVTAAQLAEFAQTLVEVHGQHDQQALLNAKEQLRLLDQFGGDALEELRQRYHRAYEVWQEARRALAAADIDESERARRIDLLRYQISEIDGVNPRAGEDVALEQERRVLVHAERLATAVEGAYALLYGGAGGGGHGVAATDEVAQAVSLLQRAAETDPRLKELAARLEEACVQLQESAPELRRYLEGLDVEPGRVDEVEARLARLHELKRKYGPTLEDVRRFRDRAAAELADLEGHDDRRAALERAVAAAEAELVEAGSALSEARARAAQGLARAIQGELAALRLGDPRLEIRLQRQPGSGAGAVVVDGEPCSPLPSGFDRVEFLFTANRGEEPRPLAKVASGGELSRVMLAIKAVMAEMDAVPVSIFDEVDAGIGGETAVAVADRLVALARHRQVLCITHLPQIAARADRQFTVRKAFRDGRTVVDVTPVTGEARVREIARMLGASQDASGLEHARALLGLSAEGRALVGEKRGPRGKVSHL